MSSLEFVIAFFPLAIYLGKTGTLSFFGRPAVRSGVNDLLFLLLGLAGLVMIGPVKLLFPIDALYVWQEKTFLFVLSLYILVSILIVGAVGPHIVLYNFRREDFLNVLSELTQSDQLLTLGNSVQIPKLNVQFTFDSQPFFRCIILKPTSRNQNLAGWLQLEQTLKQRCQEIHTSFVPQSFIIPGISCALLVAVAWNVYYLWNF